MPATPRSPCRSRRPSPPPPPVLAGAGQADATLDARLTQGSVRVVTADPVIGGLPTQGWSSKVSVGPDGTVVAGSGELKAPVRAADEPVVGAVEALAGPAQRPQRRVGRDRSRPQRLRYLGPAGPGHPDGRDGHPCPATRNRAR
ncbi:hypothetical protein ACFSNO_15120 [Streptomyces cirratus]